MIEYIEDEDLLKLRMKEYVLIKKKEILENNLKKIQKQIIEKSHEL